MKGVRIAFFGSSLVSTYWNGAATYYRGIIRQLHRRGHRVRFYEPDAFDRQAHRDLDDPPWADVVVYSAATEVEAGRAVESARDCDILIKASGVGVHDAFLERELVQTRRRSQSLLFWDVDAPATLARLDRDPQDPFHALLPSFDMVLTYGGGPEVVRRYEQRGARACAPIYNGLDPSTHHPVDPDDAFDGALALLANRLPDREERIHEFFFRPAELLGRERFLLGGNGWAQDAPELPNVVRLGHVPSRLHNTFNSSPRAVLNVNRASMAEVGYSPPTRIFEAAGAAACLICDAWPGIEEFFTPGEEVLVAASGDEVVDLLRALDRERARAIGRAAHRRALAQHTYAERATRVDEVLTRIRR